MKKISTIFIISAFAFFSFPAPAFPQDAAEKPDKTAKPEKKPSPLLGALAKSPGSAGPKQPTRVSSDSMTVDMSQNSAVFTGNVIVDDERMKIHCRQMTLYFEDKEPVPEDEKKEKAADKKEASTEEELGDKKELSRILCLGNVIIIRKIYDEEEQKKGEQKSLSGKADYDVKAGKIYLTEDNPVIYRGYDELRANKITIWIDSERVDSEGNVQITVNKDPSPVEDNIQKKKDADKKRLEEEKQEKMENGKADEDASGKTEKRTF